VSHVALVTVISGDRIDRRTSWFLRLGWACDVDCQGDVRGVLGVLCNITYFRPENAGRVSAI